MSRRNDGVAPAYLFYPVQWRVVNAAGATVTQLKTQMTRRWLPGDMQSTVTLALPASLPAGDYALQTAITDARASRGCCWLTKAKPPTAGIN